jgi:hypothetical protein
MKKVHPASIAGKSPSFTTDLKTHIRGSTHYFDHSGSIPIYTPFVVDFETSDRMAVTSYEAEPIRQRSGVILVRKFKDVRTADHNCIGVKRNLYNMPIADIRLKNAASLDSVVTECIAEALKHTGYTVVMEGSSGVADLKPDAVLEGQIQDFWSNMMTILQHNITLKMSLLDDDGQIVWNNTVGGDASALIFVTHREYEAVIDRAMEIALEKAMRSFSSDEFALKVKK